MKALLTGGNGFVGRNILEEILTTTEWSVVCLINKHFNNIPPNILKITNLKECCDKIDVIIHAGGIPSSKSCIANPENGLLNITSTFEILEFARTTNVKNIIFFSSCEVYGQSNDESVETDLLKSYNMYGASKVSCEHMCSAYCNTYGLNITCIRLVNTYGPHCQPERFPSIIIEKFKNENVPHFILSDKSKKRWLDIQEMAKRIVFIIKNMPHRFEVFNFVGDENLTLVEFIKMLSNGKEFTFEYKKDLIAGYNHSGNADGIKFNLFYNKYNLNK
jgi:UDP-glucose 4-epimerase